MCGKEHPCRPIICVGTIFYSVGMVFQNFPKGNVFRQGLLSAALKPFTPPSSLAHITVTLLLPHLSEGITRKWGVPRVKAGLWPSKVGINNGLAKMFVFFCKTALVTLSCL